jgi:integrase
MERPRTRGLARGSEDLRGAHLPCRRSTWASGRRGAERSYGRARVVQGAAQRAGLDPTTFAGHSLRAGFATTAAKKGKSLDAIMRQTLHKSQEVARGYIRHAKLFDDNAAVGFA